MTEARKLFDHQRDAAAAKRGHRSPERLRIVDPPDTAVSGGQEPASETTLATGAMVRLVRAGWDYKVRCGKRIWSHEEITGGFWVSEQMAMHRNTERKD